MFDIFSYKETLGSEVNENSRLGLFIKRLEFRLDEICELVENHQIDDISDKSTRNYFYIFGKTKYKTPFLSNVRIIVNDLLDFKDLNGLALNYTSLLNVLDNTHFKLFYDAWYDISEETKAPYSIHKVNDDYLILPKESKELDNLVNLTFKKLENYPNSLQAFIKATKAYTQIDNSSEIADLFRKALEIFFKEFFNSDKSLENMLNNYGTYLKSNGIPKEIANEFKSIINCYAVFNNNYAKHNDRTPEIILSYILYSTGNIINLLLKLKEEELTNS